MTGLTSVAELTHIGRHRPRTARVLPLLMRHAPLLRARRRPRRPPTRAGPTARSAMSTVRSVLATRICEEDAGPSRRGTVIYTSRPSKTLLHTQHIHIVLLPQDPKGVLVTLVAGCF